MTPAEVKALNKGRYKFRDEHSSVHYSGFKKLPGHVLVEDFLAPNGGDLRSLSVRTRIPYLRLYKLIRGQDRIDERMANSLARFYNNKPEFWLELQEKYEKGIKL